MTKERQTRTARPTAFVMTPRHEWPGRIALSVGLAMSMSCVSLLIVLLLGSWLAVRRRLTRIGMNPDWVVNPTTKCLGMPTRVWPERDGGTNRVRHPEDAHAVLGLDRVERRRIARCPGPFGLTGIGHVRSRIGPFGSVGNGLTRRV